MQPRPSTRRHHHLLCALLLGAVATAVATAAGAAATALSAEHAGPQARPHPSAAPSASLAATEALGGAYTASSAGNAAEDGLEGLRVMLAPLLLHRLNSAAAAAATAQPSASTDAVDGQRRQSSERQLLSSDASSGGSGGGGGSGSAAAAARDVGLPLSGLASLAALYGLSLDEMTSERSSTTGTARTAGAQEDLGGSASPGAGGAAASASTQGAEGGPGGSSPGGSSSGQRGPSSPRVTPPAADPLEPPPPFVVGHDSPTANSAGGVPTADHGEQAVLQSAPHSGGEAPLVWRPASPPSAGGGGSGPAGGVSGVEGRPSAGSALMYRQGASGRLGRAAGRFAAAPAEACGAGGGSASSPQPPSAGASAAAATPPPGPPTPSPCGPEGLTLEDPHLYDMDYVLPSDDQMAEQNPIFDPLYRTGQLELECSDPDRPGPTPGLCLAPHAPLLIQLVQPLYDDDYVNDFGTAVYGTPEAVYGPSGHQLDALAAAKLMTTATEPRPFAFQSTTISQDDSSAPDQQQDVPSSVGVTFPSGVVAHEERLRTAADPGNSTSSGGISSTNGPGGGVGVGGSGNSTGGGGSPGAGGGGSGGAGSADDAYVSYAQRIIFSPLAALINVPYPVSIYSGNLYLAEADPLLTAQGSAARAGLLVDYYLEVNYYTPFTFARVGPSAVAVTAGTARSRGQIGVAAKARALAQALFSYQRSRYLANNVEVALGTRAFAGASVGAYLNNNPLVRNLFLLQGPDLGGKLGP
ncbi:hypothetical protein HYH03_006769 [Edaphochlamys debaryana]|uniref:Uncharacterized protein n=1 Tax=Edaphochlamys debaryana TaxID=47281 RepID=A0A836C0R7_9CHLO|nr:hypothetical protein HYH03_006769 [Edaphochlamys debaryana]|eukprot:KAG2495162.1 hypothetical protein HYH03_006769 [Edaphochlamys debaryana]